MTHGEVYVHRRMNIDFTHDIDRIIRNFERLPKRMTRSDALEYYGKKLRKCFLVEDVTIKDFAKIDHYFDYFEAKRKMALK